MALNVTTGSPLSNLPADFQRATFGAGLNPEADRLFNGILAGMPNWVPIEGSEKLTGKERANMSTWVRNRCLKLFGKRKTVNAITDARTKKIYLRIVEK